MTRPHDLRRWRGLALLTGDLIEHGSAAIERVHLRTADRPFSILEQVPVVGVPARFVHVIHDGTAAVTYASIRLVNRALRIALGALLDRIEPSQTDPPRLPPRTSGD